MRIRNRGRFLALLAVVSLLVAFQASAQEEISTASRETLTHPTSLETFLERPGILIVKQQHPLATLAIGSGGEMRIDALAAHEPGMQHQRVMGIRIEIDDPGLAGQQRIFYLDLHEIDELVRAIDLMQGAMEEERPVREGDRTEMSISTQDGLAVGVRFGAGGASLFLRTPSAVFPLQPPAFETLRTRLDEGRKHLFSN